MPRSAVCILGDQLAPSHPALPADPSAAPCVFMIESLAEARHVWSHKARVAVFLSAMRHHAECLRGQGYTVVYSTLHETGQQTLVQRLFALCAQHGIEELHVLEPGEWRLEQELVAMARQQGVALRLWPDPHFLCSRAEFAQWAGNKKTLRMEFFYRTLRKRYQVLMQGEAPVGGQWNFDHDNQGAFPKTGPGPIAPPAAFAPDAISQAVFADIEALLPNHPGQLYHFAWPVTRASLIQHGMSLKG